MLRHALRLGGLIGLWVAAVMSAAQEFTGTPLSQFGVDAHAYWLTAHQPALYGNAPHTLDAYLYSPLFAQVIHPVALLPFAWFYITLAVVDAACVAWLLKPLGWRWAVPIMLMLSTEFILGNVTGIITVAVVAGVTGRAGALSLGWLTKVVPGLLGLTWLLTRGEWKQARLSVLWTTVLVVVSFALWPSAWLGWVTFLHSNPDPHAQARVVLALALVVVGARRNWWWVFPVALLIGAPVMNLYNLTYLTALPRLKEHTWPSVPSAIWSPNSRSSRKTSRSSSAATTTTTTA